MAGVRDLEQAVLGEISRDRMRDWLLVLGQIDRTSGTEGEYQAVDFIVDVLRSEGIPYRVHEFRAYLSYPRGARLRVLEPRPREIACKTRAFGASTPSGGLEGELVFVPVHPSQKGVVDELADPELDYRGRDVAGKIVLAERGGPGAVEAAQKAGALAHVHLWESDEDALHEMIVTTVWGTPTPDAAARIPRIPSLTVRRADGLWLADLSRSGPVRVELQAQVETGWRRLLLPEALIPGAEDAELFVLVGGHLDSWHTGVTDNATGNVACLELARVLNRFRDRLGRSVRVAWWPGHSTGRYAGSTWYADKFWSDLHEGCVAYINVDSPGSLGATDYSDLVASEDCADLAQQVVYEITGQRGRVERPIRAGDQSFWGPGVSSLYMLLSNLPRDRWYAVGGSGMNWWWHTEADTLDKADLDILAKDTAIYLLTTVRLTNSPFLPIRLTGLASAFLQEAESLQAKAGSLFDLGPVLELAKKFTDRAQAVDHMLASGEAGGEPRRLNRQLLAIVHGVIPVLYTAAGPFHHDPASSVPALPGLAGAGRLPELDPESDQFGFLYAYLMREVNRATWVLKVAIGRCEAILGVEGHQSTS